MNFVVKIKKNFLILLTAMLLVGCNNNDIKDIDINKTIITNEKVTVKFLGKKDNSKAEDLLSIFIILFNLLLFLLIFKFNLYILTGF